MSSSFNIGMTESLHPGKGGADPDASIHRRNEGVTQLVDDRVVGVVGDGGRCPTCVAQKKKRAAAHSAGKKQAQRWTPSARATHVTRTLTRHDAAPVVLVGGVPGCWGEHVASRAGPCRPRQAATGRQPPAKPRG